MLDVIRRNSQSWVVKLVFAAIIVTFVFFGANSMTSDSVEVMAKVNGESIYRNDVLQELRAEIANIQFTNPGLGQLDDEQLNGLALQILGRMVSRTLMAQQARSLGLSVSNAELSAMVTSMPDFQDATGRFNHDIYKDRLANMGFTVSRFEEMAETDLLIGKLQSYITSSVKVEPAEARRIFDFEFEKRVVDYVAFPVSDYLGSVNPDEAAIISYYSENKDLFTVPAKAQLEYLTFDMEALAAQSNISDEDVNKYYEERRASFTEPARYQVRHILVALPLTLDTADESVIEARKKADSIVAELKAGKNFAELARQYSDDANTKDNGGDIGWVERGQIDASLDLALASLQPGEFSEPIRTVNGFHVLQVVAAQPEREKPLDEVRGDIMAQLKEDAAYARMGETMSAVEDKIISQESFGAVAQEFGVTPKSTELAELPQIAAALGLTVDMLAGVPDVPAGQMLPMPIDLGRGFMVIKVNAYNPSYVPGLEDVRAQIVAALKAQGAIQLASEAASEALKETIANSGNLPASAAGKAKTSEPATRFLGMVELGFSQELTAALFTAPVGQWLDRVFLVGDNAVLARVSGTVAPTEAEWAEISGQYADGLNNIRKSEMFNVYLTQLQQNAKIDIKTDRILGR